MYSNHNGVRKSLWSLAGDNLPEMYKCGVNSETNHQSAWKNMLFRPRRIKQGIIAQHCANQKDIRCVNWSLRCLFVCLICLNHVIKVNRLHELQTRGNVLFPINSSLFTIHDECLPK